MKTHLLALLLALTTATPIGLAEPADRPKNAGKPIGKPPEFWVARRAELNARKEAQRDRVRQHKADRAAEQEKLYQDWHDRYVADAPIREAYYRTQERAYEAQAAYAYSATPPTIIIMNEYAGLTNSTFGCTGFTPSCSTSRSSFFTANYAGRRLAISPAIQLPAFQP